MRLEIAHTELIHKSLKQIAENYKERGLLGVEEEDEGKGLSFPGFGFSSEPINLPAPLKNTGFAVKSRGGFYSAVTPIVASADAYLNGLSNHFARAFDESKSGLEWFPVDGRGAGYIVKEETPIIAIARFSTSKHSRNNGRVIALGDLGAAPCKIESDLEEFNQRMRMLQKTTTVFINSIYEINGVKKRVERDITLFLDCIV